MNARSQTRRVVIVDTTSRTNVDLSPSDFIADGAAGEVYRIPRHIKPASCIKLYKRPDKDCAAKLIAMLQRPPDGTTGNAGGRQFVRFAWPTQLVEDGRGNVIGFVMPEVDFKGTRSLVTYTERREAQRFLSPEQRSLPRRLAVCTNLCALMADLHQQGHAFVDFKDQNVRVYPDLDLVGFIDNDGFRIEGPGGRIFSGLYTTPTFNSPESVRGPRGNLGELHDRFVLAILLFRILNVGIHPFQGVPQRALANGTAFDTDQLIEHQAYAYGAHPCHELAPTVGSQHEFWDSKTLAMFERTFTTKKPHERISATEWVRHLRSLQQKGLVRCDNHPTDIEHVHFIGNRCPHCRAASSRGSSATTSSTSNASFTSSGTASTPPPPSNPPSTPNSYTSPPSSSSSSSFVTGSGLPPPQKELHIGTKVFLGLSAVVFALWAAAASGVLG